jgi:hypothetical protein
MLKRKLFKYIISYQIINRFKKSGHADNLKTAQVCLFFISGAKEVQKIIILFLIYQDL